MSEQNERLGIGAAISTFTESLVSLREFLELVSSFLADKESEFMRLNLKALIPMRLAMAAVNPDRMPLTPDNEKMLRDEFGAEVILKPGDEPGRCQIEVLGEQGKQFNEALKALAVKSHHRKLLTKNCLISLISSAEWFLSRILRDFFTAYPNAAGVEEKFLTLQDLRRIGSVSEAQSYLIMRRVDEIMWGSFEDWIKYLRDNVKLSMGYLKEDEEELTEVFQRRNALVHSDGKANQTYITKVAARLRENLEVGNELEIDTQYVHHAIDLIERNFVLIGAELWKKLSANDEARSEVLTNLTLSSLTSNRFKLAEATSRFTMADKQLTERSQLVGLINFWQTKKWDGNFETVRSEIESADFSAKEDLFQLGRLVLLDKFDEAIPMIEDLLRRERLEAKDVEEWPIFRTIRADPRLAAIVQKHRAQSPERVPFPADTPLIAMEIKEGPTEDGAGNMAALAN